MSRKNIFIGMVFSLITFYLLIFGIKNIPTLSLESQEYWMEAARNFHRVLFCYLFTILIFQKNIFGKYLDVLLAIMVKIGFYMIDVIFFSVTIQYSVILQILFGGVVTFILVSMFHQYLFGKQKILINR
jgi:hypothetical protein